MSLGPDPELYIHKWVSPVVPTGFSNIVMDGTGELDLWTQTINGATNPGKTCIWLFTRHLNGLGIPVDTFAVNTGQPGNLPYFTYSQSSWPSNGWSEIHIPLSFLALTLPAGEQRVSVVRAGDRFTVRSLAAAPAPWRSRSVPSGPASVVLAACVVAFAAWPSAA